MVNLSMLPRNLTTAFVSVSLSLAVAGDPAFAGPTEEADAFLRSIYTKGFEEAQQTALNGDAVAQRHIGTLFLQYVEQGFGATQAIKWFQLAAAQGDQGSALASAAALISSSSCNKHAVAAAVSRLPSSADVFGSTSSRWRSR